MKRIVFITFAAVLLLAGAVHAQDDDIGFRGWGPRVGLTVDPDQIHFGGHVDFGYLAQHLRLQPNFELGFGDDLTVAAANFEVNYRFAESWEVWTPYAGGGLGLIFINYDVEGVADGSDTELGASILGGIEKGLSDGNRFFLEAKLGLADAPDFKVTAGWTFGH